MDDIELLLCCCILCEGDYENNKIKYNSKPNNNNEQKTPKNILIKRE